MSISKAEAIAALQRALAGLDDGNTPNNTVDDVRIGLTFLTQERCKMRWVAGMLNSSELPSGQCTLHAGHHLEPGDAGHRIPGHARPLSHDAPQRTLNDEHLKRRRGEE